MRPASWWGSKVRQFRAHLRARVEPAERAELGAWLNPSQLELFDHMHVADQRHGLDVVASLRRAGVGAPEVLLAGLLHDCAKGPGVGLLPRVAWSLGEAWGGWLPSTISRLPGFASAIARLRDHARLSAELAASAGCPERTVALIREQAAPRDPEYGELLRLADEAN